MVIDRVRAAIATAPAWSVERRLADLEQRVREELGKAGERLIDDERSRP